jgi:hypothetical protein
MSLIDTSNFKLELAVDNYTIDNDSISCEVTLKPCFKFGGNLVDSDDLQCVKPQTGTLRALADTLNANRASAIDGMRTLEHGGALYADYYQGLKD